MIRCRQVANKPWLRLRLLCAKAKKKPWSLPLLSINNRCPKTHQKATSLLPSRSLCVNVPLGFVHTETKGEGEIFLAFLNMERKMFGTRGLTVLAFVFGFDQCERAFNAHGIHLRVYVYWCENRHRLEWLNNFPSYVFTLSSVKDQRKFSLSPQYNRTLKVYSHDTER